MEWFAVVVSLIVLWIASLCKILHTSTNKGGALINKNVLLVIAHPDDESMFFSPTISFLISRGNNLHILCLSIGDADGLGTTRKDELCRACAVLQVPLQQVKVLNHPELQDGFGLFWDHNLLAQIIEEEVSAHEINMIITFDKYGVSGHCNHRDVHYGVRKVMHHIPQRSIEAWELVSINILRKYSGPVDIWLSMLFAITSKGTHYLQNEHTSRSFHAMAAHSSQWVWFRKLFVWSLRDILKNLSVPSAFNLILLLMGSFDQRISCKTISGMYPFFHCAFCVEQFHGTTFMDRC